MPTSRTMLRIQHAHASKPRAGGRPCRNADAPATPMHQRAGRTLQRQPTMLPRTGTPKPATLWRDFKIESGPGWLHSQAWPTARLRP
eukprot:3332157-Prymnesium_polylepis.1